VEKIRSRGRRSAQHIQQENHDVLMFSPKGEKKEPEEQIWDKDWEVLCPTSAFSWKKIALELLKKYTENTDGAYVEDKESAIVWHYESADPEYGRMQASELSKYLAKVISRLGADVVRYDYNRILEIKPKGIGKGITTSIILDAVQNNNNQAPFVLCIGDDKSDEEMFLSLQSNPRLSEQQAPPQTSNKDEKKSKKKPTKNTKLSKTEKKKAMSSNLKKRGSVNGLFMGQGARSGVPDTDSEDDDRQALDDDDDDIPQTRSSRSNSVSSSCRLFTCTVGIKPSDAHFYLHDSDEVIEILRTLSSAGAGGDFLDREDRESSSSGIDDVEEEDE